jgi:hypothetical protein
MGYLKDLLLTILLVALAYITSLFIPAEWAHGEPAQRKPYLSMAIGWAVLNEKGSECPKAEWDLVPELVRDGVWRTGSYFVYAKQTSIPFCWDLAFNGGQLMVMMKFFGERDIVLIPLDAFQMQGKPPVQGKTS